MNDEYSISGEAAEVVRQLADFDLEMIEVDDLVSDAEAENFDYSNLGSAS